MAQVDGGATATYVYDAHGRRHNSTTSAGTVWNIYDLSWNVVSRVLQNSGGGTVVSSDTFVGGRHLATQNGITTYFPQVDWLGSTRQLEDLNGNAVQKCRNLPFGDELSCTGTDVSPVHFTGQLHDSESNLEQFPFRQLTSTQGRWMMPDPAGMAAVDPTNPQTWNRYAYVANNPPNLIDLLGLCDPGDPFCVVVHGGINCNGVFVPYLSGQICQEGAVMIAGCLPIFTTQGMFLGNPCGSTPNVVGNPGDGSGGSSSTAANNGTPTPKNPCVAGALKAAAINVGIDLLGFLPEAGGVARVAGHQAGYVGKVADNLGKNMLTAGTKTTGTLASAIGFSSSDWTTWVSAGITAADFVPVLSDFTTPVAIGWDASVAVYKAYQCPK